MQRLRFADCLREIPFDTPKPTKLIRRLLQLATTHNDDSLVMDFFAGSGTTAQAVLELNREDGGNRRFLLVQLPEPTGTKQYPTIADICRERVRRVIAKLKQGTPNILGGGRTSDRKTSTSRRSAWPSRTSPSGKACRSGPRRRTSGRCG